MLAPKCKSATGHQWMPREFFGYAAVKSTCGIREDGCRHCGCGRNVDDLDPADVIYLPNWFAVAKEA